jgi:hypothetical protein
MAGFSISGVEPLGSVSIVSVKQFYNFLINKYLYKIEQEKLRGALAGGYR